MVLNESGQNTSQPALPEYQPPHLVRMNGVRGGFGTCAIPGGGNTTGACQATGAANTGYDGCIAGTTNSFASCTAGETNTGSNCIAGNTVETGTCDAGGTFN